MWSEEMAEGLIKKGTKSRSPVAKELSQFMGWMLDSVRFYQQRVLDLTEENERLRKERDVERRED